MNDYLGMSSNVAYYIIVGLGSSPRAHDHFRVPRGAWPSIDRGQSHLASIQFLISERYPLNLVSMILRV